MYRHISFSSRKSTQLRTTLAQEKSVWSGVIFVRKNIAEQVTYFLSMKENGNKEKHGEKNM